LSDASVLDRPAVARPSPAAWPHAGWPGTSFGARRTRDAVLALALDLGSSLRIDRPLPQTPLRQEIEQAEAAIPGAPATTNGDIRRALAAVDADMTPPHTT